MLSDDDINDDLLEDEDDDGLLDLDDDACFVSKKDRARISTDKRKKLELNKEVKAFVNFIKTYFSSYSARRAPHVFFNIVEDPNVLILSNTDGSLFTQSNSGELGLHVVEYKEPVQGYLSQLKETLLLDGTKHPYVVNISQYLSTLNKYKKEGTDVWALEDGRIVANVSGDTKHTDKCIFASPIKNFNVVSSIKYWYEYAINLRLAIASYPNIDMDLDPDVTMVKAYTKAPLDITDFKHNDGTLVFPNHRPEMSPILFDGVGTPSLKEFVKKKKEEEQYSYTLNAWVERDEYFRLMTQYEDDNIYAISMKPNVCYYPLPIRK